MPKWHAMGCFMKKWTGSFNIVTIMSALIWLKKIELMMGGRMSRFGAENTTQGLIKGGVDLTGQFFCNLQIFFLLIWAGKCFTRSIYALHVFLKNLITNLKIYIYLGKIYDIYWGPDHLQLISVIWYYHKTVRKKHRKFESYKLINVHKF